MLEALKLLKESLTPDTDESLPSYLGRNIAQQASRFGEGALGAIPSGLSLLASGGQRLAEHLAKPGYIWPGQPGIKESLGYKGVSKIREAAEKATPEALKTYSEKLTGGYTKPKTESEEALGKFTTDVGSMFGIGTPIKTATKIAGLGNAAYQGAKLFNASEETAEKAKIVGMLSSPLFKSSMIKPLAENLYNKVDKIASARAMNLKVPGLEKGAKDLIEHANIGAKSATYKSSLRSFANDLLEKSHMDSIPVKELWNFKKDLNYLSRGLSVPAKHKQALTKMIGSKIKQGLEDYGKRNKEFGSALSSADKLYSIEKGLPVIDRAMNKAFKVRSSGLGEYFRKALAYGAFGLKGVIGKNIAESISKSGEAFLKSSAFRNESIKLAAATTKESLPATINALRKLENIKREYPDELKGAHGMKFKFRDSEEIPSGKETRSSSGGLPKGFKFIN